MTPEQKRNQMALKVKWEMAKNMLSAFGNQDPMRRAEIAERDKKEAWEVIVLRNRRISELEYIVSAKNARIEELEAALKSFNITESKTKDDL